MKSTTKKVTEYTLTKEELSTKLELKGKVKNVFYGGDIIEITMEEELD